jgi:RNA polymerase sigma factor (sigma-70 family)
MTREHSSADDDLAAAFRRLAPRFALLVARRFSIGPEAAIDIVQDAFVKILMRNRVGAALPMSDQYLWRMVSNRAIDTLRSGTRRRQNEVALWLALSDVSPTTVEDGLIALEQSKRLNHALSLLPDSYRRIFDLLLTEELSLAAIARRLNVNLGSIYTQYQRGIDKLRSLLTEIST